MILKNLNNDTCLSDLQLDGWSEITQQEYADICEQKRFIPEPLPLPPISPRQIRQALTRAGLRAAVEAAVSAGDQDLKDWYEFSTAFERLHPQVVVMGSALGQSDTQLDALWAIGLSL
jgi:hypothetical protein